MSLGQHNFDRHAGTDCRVGHSLLLPNEVTLLPNLVQLAQRRSLWNDITERVWGKKYGCEGRCWGVVSLVKSGHLIFLIID